MSPICAVTAWTSPIALLHRGELFRDAREAAGHLFFDGGVELFVHGLLDIGQSRLVAFSQLPQPGIHG